MNPLRRVPVLLLLALMLGCTAEQRAVFAELRAVQEKEAAEFRPAEVSVNLMNGTHLVVTVVNSTLNTADDASRQLRARKAAQIAADALPGVEDVAVNFMKKSGGFGFTMTDSSGYYRFLAADVRTAAAH